MLQRCLVFILAATLCAIPGATDHLVSPKAVDAKLSAAAKERTQNLATLDHLLSSPKVVTTATSAGIDLGMVKGALPALSDSELRDLAQRTRSLRSDVVAGQYVIYDDHDPADALMVFMVVIAVVAAALIVADNY